MKKPTTTLFVAASLVIMGAGGCGTTDTAGGQMSAASVPAEQTALFAGDGGKGISLAILAPEAQGLEDTQNYIPALVQGEFVSNFTGYSAISVLDREHLDEQYAEILSGYYDDDAEAGADLGHLVPTEYIMGGSIIKTASGFALQIRVTKTSDKTTLCSYSGTCTFAELDNLTGVRRTSLDLLGKMGVQLTARAQGELSGAAAAHEVQGQTALAQGVTAQHGGTVVEALSYYFQAASYDASLTEAASRVNILTANITSGNMGEDIRNDIQWRDQWRARLAEAEQVYANYVQQQPLYSLVYDADLKHGETNYSNNTVPISGVTLDLVPDAAWFNTAGSVVRVINVVREGLLATKQAEKWGLNWPRNTVGNSPFGDRDQRFEVVVELVNSEGKTIGSERITMRSGYDVEWSEGALRRFMPRMRGIQNLGFSRVNAYDITTNLTVRIASIDGVAAETAAKTKGINILREAEYARLPEVVAGVDSRAIARFMQDFEITHHSTAYRPEGFHSASASAMALAPAGGEITRYKGAAKDIVIPGDLFGYPLTAIGKAAFTKTVSVYRSDLGRNVEETQGIGLTSVIIRNGITHIAYQAFHGTEPSRGGPFYAARAPGITSVTFPDSLVGIGMNAFFYNDLTSITIPNSVTHIEDGAFGYNLLTSITLPRDIAIDTHVLGYILFGAGFPSVYNKNGKKAGTYTRPATNSTKWTYRP